MTPITREPRAYRPRLWTRLAEGFRYGGGIGQWSWFWHRVSGLGILLFLVIHIIDTFLVVAYPEWYDHTVGIYGGMVTGLPWQALNGYHWPLRVGFRLGELALIACVLFHALNGLRIIALDFSPRASLYQRELYRAVAWSFGVIMALVTIVVIVPLFSAPNHWKMPAAAAPAESDTVPMIGD